MGILDLLGAELGIYDQLDKYVFPSLTIFVNSVIGCLPWCNSNGATFNPVCIVNRITRKALFTLSR